MFRSAEEAFSEHRTECGTGDDIGPVLLPLGFDIAKIDELARRSVGQGCGHVYYKCPSRLDHRDVQKHKERTCTKGYVAEDGTKGPCLDSDGEPLKYRRCMYWEQDHNARIARIWGMSKHSDDVDDEANAGGTLHACGIHPTSDSGSHTSYTCNISPCSNFVWWGCVYAQCPETDNHGKVVCTISGCQDSTPYDATSSSAGLHAYCNECSQYKCTGGGHSWYPSCTDTTHTNSNGDSCTVAGYECVSHTPVYPAAP